MKFCTSITLRWCNHNCVVVVGVLFTGSVVDIVGAAVKTGAVKSHFYRAAPNAVGVAEWGLLTIPEKYQPFAQLQATASRLAHEVRRGRAPRRAGVEASLGGDRVRRLRHRVKRT
jgi:hypothetical protein